MTIIIIIIIVTANILIFINGIHMGWTSPSLRKILSEDYPLQVSEEEGSYIAIISYIGDIVGGIYGCSLINIIGRRNTLLSITVPYVMSFGLIAISNYGTVFLYLARVLGKLIHSVYFHDYCSDKVFSSRFSLINREKTAVGLTPNQCSARLLGFFGSQF